MGFEMGRVVLTYWATDGVRGSTTIVNEKHILLVHILTDLLNNNNIIMTTKNKIESSKLPTARLFSQ